jgi:hypothetical protein
LCECRETIEIPAVFVISTVPPPALTKTVKCSSGEVEVEAITNLPCPVTVPKIYGRRLFQYLRHPAFIDLNSDYTERATAVVIVLPFKITALSAEPGLNLKDLYR